MNRVALAAAFCLPLLAACGAAAVLPYGADMGPNPTLVQPRRSLLPTMNIAKAVGWPAGAMPTSAAGLKVNAFASGLDHPRWLYVLPNGDVLAAETNAPPKPDDSKGVKGFIMKMVMKDAGAGTPTANRITLLRDADGDGVADLKTVLISGLNSPYGMALVGDTLYIADTDALVKVPYSEGQTRIDAAPVKVIDLPGGTINHHWTKNVVAAGDGKTLYVSVGSNSNVGENGPAAEEGRAAIWQVDPATGAHRVFASGLRNPNGMGFAPGGGTLWTVVNERDEIGSDLVPDYLTSVKDGAFYGWPDTYYGPSHHDRRVKWARPDMIAKAIAPDYALGAHTASLGLAFATADGLTPAWRSGAFVGQHGSWNRTPRSGYKVIYVPFSGGKPAGAPRDVLTGFLDGDKARGRPVGLAMDKRGALLVADDVGDTVWRVSGL